MGKPIILLLLLLVSSFSLFLLHEARPLYSPHAEENLITVSRKGSSGAALSGLKRGGSGGKVPNWSTPARTVPVLIPGSTTPKTSTNASKKSGATKVGCSFFFVSLITIALVF